MEIFEELEYVGDTDNVLYGSLTGMVFKVTTRFNDEYLYDVQVRLTSNVSGKPEYELTGGYAVSVFWYLQSLLNFTYIINSDVATMTFDKKSVDAASIDIYIASFSLRLDRVKYVDPTFSIGQSRILAFMDHSFEADSADQNLYFTPFTTGLWICTLGVLLLFMITFLVLSQFEKNSSTGDILFHFVSIVLQKGSDVPSFHDSTRLVTILLSVLILVMMASYSGIMTSIFAVNRYSITTLDALVQSNYKVLLEYGVRNTKPSTIVMMLQALSQMGVSRAEAVLKKADKSNFVYTTFIEAIRQVRRSPSAYIIDEETGLDTISQELEGLPCSMAKLPVFNLRYPWVMYIKKNSSFEDKINSGLVRIRERGVLNRIRKKWISLPASSSCETPYKSIAFTQVRDTFVFLIVVIVLGLCPALLLFEKLIALYAKRLNRNNVVTISSNSLQDVYFS